MMVELSGFDDLMKKELRSLLREELSLLDTQKAPPQERLFDINEVAEFLGAKTSTIRKYVKDRLIPTHKLFGKLLFIESEILEWVKTHKIKTQDELEEEVLESFNL